MSYGIVNRNSLSDPIVPSNYIQSSNGVSFAQAYTKVKDRGGINAGYQNHFLPVAKASCWYPDQWQYLKDYLIEWDKPLEEFSKAYNRIVVFYKATNGQYFTFGDSVASPTICEYFPETTPKFSKRVDTNCPCNCKDVTTKKVMYLNRTKQSQNDQIVPVSNKKIVCDSKAKGKRYVIPCENNAQINQALNQLSDDCPCDCKEVFVNEDYYLSEIKIANSIPVEVDVTETICTTKDVNNRTVPCEALNKAVANLSDDIEVPFFQKYEKEIIIGGGVVVLGVLIKGLLS